MHTLLQADWTSETVADALRLAREILSAAGCPVRFSWEEMNGRAEAIVVDPGTSEQLRDFMLTFFVDQAPQSVPHLPARRGRQSVRLAHAAEELSVLLNFQYLAKARSQTHIDDASGFFRNCQSLVAVVGMQFLLPELKSRRLHKEAAFAANAIALHIAQIWHDDPPHQAYLSGMLSRFLRNGEATRRSLEYAFAATSPDDHDYLTTAHELWYYYLDSGNLETAREFVLSLYRSSPQEYLEEIEEMVGDTYAAVTA